MCDSVTREFVMFVREYYKTADLVPLHAPLFTGKEREYVLQCIDSSYVSYVSEFVNRFESAIEAFTGARHAVAVSSGTAALHTALILVGVGPGDEVVMSPLTFAAAGNAVAYTGATPVFVDCDADTLGLSPYALKKFFDRSTKRTRDGLCVNRNTDRRVAACLPVHVFGQPARIEAIASVCLNHGVPLVEDAAESLGSWSGDRHTGTFGAIGVLSFNGNKTITTGGGGAVLSSDDRIAERARHLTTTAKVPHAWRFFHDEVGYNYRMPGLNAALGVAQIERLPVFLEEKRQLASAYADLFARLGIEFMGNLPGTRSNHWLNCIFLRSVAARDEFLRTTNAMGVMTRPAWVLLSDLPAFRHCYAENLPNATKRGDTAANVPSGVSAARVAERDT